MSGTECLPAGIARHAHLEHVRLGAGIDGSNTQALGHVVEELERLQGVAVEIDAETDSHYQCDRLATGSVGFAIKPRLGAPRGN